jgi:hypothetical protein
MRVMTVILLVMGVFLAIFLFFSYNLDKRACERTLASFRNSLILFEKVQNRYPENLEELLYQVPVLGIIDTKQYTWIESENGLPPQLYCRKHKRSSLLTTY